MGMPQPMHGDAPVTFLGEALSPSEKPYRRHPYAA